MEIRMTRTVNTADLVLLAKKTKALWKAVEAALRISTDLDEDKRHIKDAVEYTDRDQKRLRKGNHTKKKRDRIERTIEYHQELSSSTAAECEPKSLQFSEAVIQVESVSRDLAEIYDWLAKVPRFEHIECSSPLKRKRHERTAA
jgi:hypothetical protein